MGDRFSDELPPTDVRRWSPRRKWQVVSAVLRGWITLDEACERYQLSPEEFLGWERIVHNHGVRGLRVSQKRLPSETR